MRVAVARLIPALLLSGCGQGDPVGNQALPKAAANVTAPINDSVPANRADAPVPAPPQPKSRFKPLVSRETSAPVPQRPDYRAIGTEPFWAVTVHGSTAMLQRPDKPALRFAVSRTDDARAIRYLGDGFVLTATEGPCSDGMSDVLWSDRVQIAFGDGVLKGCGGEREDDGMGGQ
ncbi:membrane-like protein [Sphingobium sp.]|uniref:membrane-like protein n=1 Tax=Sphingobium sp. TaxID=1912891 RepID=UPI00262AB506|nr:membrane-like protein [Sphingobium sp.]